MSLPEHFIDPEEYFEECHKFFEEYQYLYNYPNTQVLVHNILDRIQVNHLDKIDIYEKKFNLETIEDEFLNTFFQKLKRLRVTYNEFEEHKVLEDIFDVPLSPKKKHEIIYLAKEIKDTCDKIKCNTVVDFGSGLGYLDQLVFDTTNYKVLGLECNENHYVSAKKRQGKYHKTSKENVKYIKHTISEDSNINIKYYLEDKFKDYGGFCITGLHACADLTIDAINIFLKMPDAKSLILMPCCYHKMAVKEHGFKNFPLSSCMKNVYKNSNSFEYMKVPFLRLGAQPPHGYENLHDSVFNLLARAVLEQYAQEKNCKLSRNKRKAVKLKTMDNNFENYIQDVSNHGFSLTSNEKTTEQFDLDMLRVNWKQIDNVTKKRAGILIILQNLLQPVIENIILFDRLVYLYENDIKNCRYKKIFNEKISPRCLALLAYK